MVVDKMGDSTSHTTPKTVQIKGIDDTDGSTHVLDAGNVVDLNGKKHHGLRTSHTHGLNSIAVTSPGVAYANGANALCIAAPTNEAYIVELEAIFLSVKVAGDFYLVAANLGNLPGTTTNNVFDLVGVKADYITSTSDVVWAAFLGNTGKGDTGGDFHFDLTPGKELYLIAPNIDYNLVVTWIQETV